MGVTHLHMNMDWSQKGESEPLYFSLFSSEIRLHCTHGKNIVVVCACVLLHDACIHAISGPHWRL